MKKKTVHIISHSHWDREWYMAYEQHHMRLINLVDDLLDLFETDPDFDSFHLDGQTIILDDYLQVRPERRDEVQAAIKAGKLRIGPFYILQDDFLISPESNVRNMQIGRLESEKWGAPVELGYFPDTFGNMGQTPQMMLEGRLTTAAFGRGVKPIGFDNKVLDSDADYTSQYSEMWWQGPDGSKILGILFANWYSNGNEIPSEPEAAIKFWKQKLADAEQFSSTSHLLMMNGVDHQPVQKDLSKAIKLANELFPDYEFIHSNWPKYLEAVRNDLPEDLSTVTGELTSQETDGWYTLANTASARVYLKQTNTRVERKLENVAEPLAALAYKVGGDYPHDKLTYAWKTLLQNHPHDSICGCSLDPVHREMMTRFEKAETVADYVAEDALITLSKAIKAEGQHPFVVVNTAGFDKTGEAKVEVVLEKKFFRDGVPDKLYDELKAQPKGVYKVVSADGKEVAAEISEEQVLFDYDLPKRTFRVPYMKRFVKVKLFLQDMKAFSWQTFDLVTADENSVTSHESLISGQTIENDLLKLSVSADGSLQLTDKRLDKTFDNLLVFEDTGDIGNEYIYFQPKNTKAILSKNVPAQFSVITDRPEIAQVKLTQTLMIPKSADEKLEEEQKKVLEFRDRTAGRSPELVPLELTTIITVRKDSAKVDFETSFDNQMKDHRVRVLFPSGLTAETHEADSIYEVVTRPNKMPKTWQNPTNPQHQGAFVNLHNDDFGLTVGNFGLNEYEIVGSSTIALTLLRAVGELGDWGYFPTPEAQVQGKFTFNYSLEFHGQPSKRYDTYKHAYAAQVPFSSTQLDLSAVTKNNLPAAGTIVDFDSLTFAPTSLHRRNSDLSLVLRGYNMSDQTGKISVSADKKLNLLEEEIGESKEELAPYEIRTVQIKEDSDD